LLSRTGKLPKIHIDKAEVSVLNCSVAIALVSALTIGCASAQIAKNDSANAGRFPAAEAKGAASQKQDTLAFPVSPNGNVAHLLAYDEDPDSHVDPNEAEAKDRKESQRRYEDNLIAESKVTCPEYLESKSYPASESAKLCQTGLTSSCLSYLSNFFGLPTAIEKCRGNIEAFCLKSLRWTSIDEAIDGCKSKK
jgi:hypothetical protein